MNIIELTVRCERNERQHLTIDIVGSGSFKFATDVSGDCNNVIHQHFNIFENGVVDVLQDVVWLVGFCGDYFECVIDEPITKGLDLVHRTFDVKLRYDFFQFVGFHGWIDLLCLVNMVRFSMVTGKCRKKPGVCQP